MSELVGIYAIWEREFKVFLREKSRVAASILNPLFWLFIFGTGLGSHVTLAGTNYQVFLYPGIIVMTCLFTSMFYGVYVLWDKRLDFLKEVLVAPLRRSSIFLGKVLGGITDAILQVLIMMVLAPYFGVHLGWNLVPIFAFLIVLITGLVSVGLAIGSVVESPEAFGLINSMINFPLFFLSGALFPLTDLPVWLTIFTRINPVTYGVDAMRTLMLGIGTFSLALDAAVLALFAAVMIGIGTYAFGKMKI